jgi:hypothetical protein
MTEILCILLMPALRFLDNPKKYWYFFWAPIPAWLVDFFLCHTFWALAFGWPKEGEVTISDMLERLCNEYEHPDNLLFIQIGLKINRVAGFAHIKTLAPAQDTP